MGRFRASGRVDRFPGEHGWFYVQLDESLCRDLRPLVKDAWPALLKASSTINTTRWVSSIMPMRDGPLFIALPARVREAEGIEEGQSVTIDLELMT